MPDSECITMEDALRTFPAPRGLYAYAHELCPDAGIIDAKGKVHPRSFGYLVPLSADWVADGFNVSPHFSTHLDEMFADSSIEISQHLPDGLFVVAELDRYWRLCLEALSGFSGDNITVSSLSNAHIDHIPNDGANTLPKATVDKAIRTRLAAVNNYVFYYDMHRRRADPHAESFALYRGTASRPLEDKLFDLFNEAYTGTPDEHTDFEFAMRVAIATYVPQHKDANFIAWAKFLYNHARQKMAEVRKEDKNASALIANATSYALDLVRCVAGRLAGIYDTPEQQLPTADMMQKAGGALAPGEKMYLIGKTLDQLTDKEIAQLIFLPKSLIEPIHHALIQKIRFLAQNQNLA